MFDNEKVKTLNELEMLVYDYILKHRKVVVEMSIRELSATCHVSTATIVRMCHKLNLSGFSELKYVIKQKIETDTLYNLDYFYHETSQIDTFLKRVNHENYRKTLEIAIDMIVAANHIIFTGIGTSGILGMYGSRYFMNVGLNCYSLTDAFAPVSPRLQKNTLVIALSVSGETPEVLDQIKEFKRILATLRKDIPVYLTPGNHDVGQQPTSASLAGYIDTYGYDCFSFQMNGTCFIGINTQIIWADVKEAEQSQLVWLTKVLENSQKCTHRILFGHHPVFVHSADEADKYDNFPLAKRNDYLNLFNRFNVSDQFAGHLHYNSNGQHGNFRITGTSAVGMQIGKEKSGLRIVKVYPDKVESTYYPLDEVPAIVEL